MKDSKRLATTILISGVGTLLSYLINFFLTPYISENVGIEAYGFVSIAKTAVSYAQIVMVALTTFIVRFIAINYHKEDIERSKAYYSSSIVACVTISTIIYVIAILVTFNLEKLLVIPDELVHSVKILFLLAFLNFVFTTLVTPLNSGSYIKNRLDLNGILKIISYLTESVCLIIIFSLIKPDVWIVGLGSVIASLVLVIGNYFLNRKLIPEIKFEKKLVSFQCVKDMISNGIWQSINSLGNVLNSGLDLIISNLMLSAIETGQIAVVKTIALMFSTLYQVVGQPFQPRMLKVYSKDDKNLFFVELKKAMKICGYFSNVAFAGFVALGWSYFKLWLPNEDTNVLYILAIITVFGSITEGIAQPMYYVNTLTLKKKFPCIVTVCGGVLNTLSMILLLNFTNIGVYSIVLTTAVIMTCINLIFSPTYCALSLKLNPLNIYKVIFRHILSVILMIIVFKFVAYIFIPNNWIALIIEAFIMAVLGLFVHVFIMTTKDEKRRIVNKIANKS